MERTQELFFRPRGIEHFAGDRLPKDMMVAMQFVKLLETHFREEHQSEFYAARTNLTVRRLNALLRTYYGQTAYELIQLRIHQEAVKLLLYTSLTVREISFALGICHPSFFSKCFKEQEGCAPKAYRCKNAGQKVG